MITKEQIIKLAEEALEGSDKFVVNVSISKNNVIGLYLDSDSSVTIDDCVKVSRYIKFLLVFQNQDVAQSACLTIEVESVAQDEL